MSRRTRMLDNASGVVELSSRTIQGRYFFVPGPGVNEIILGVLGRAQRLSKVQLFTFVFMSNHFHILMRVESAKQMAVFAGYVKSNLARELGRMRGWEGAFWGARDHSGSLADGSPETLNRRFRYILSNGCKENLVASPLDWPGVSAAGALYRGKWKLSGTWYDRTAECHARAAGRPQLFPIKETVQLSPLPFLEEETAETQQEYVVRAVRELEEDTRDRHVREGTKPLGARAICERNPLDRPKDFKSKPAPLFYASTKEEFEALSEARAEKTAAYREAADRLKNGERDVEFPEGTFPPPAPFVEPRAPS